MLWTGLGWIGIASGVLAILGAFQLAEEGFVIAGTIGVILEIIWFLGVGVGRYRGLPGEEAQPETAGRQQLTSCAASRTLSGCTR